MQLKNLDPPHTHDAIAHGVFQAFPALDPDKVYRAISQGVYDAIWRMITNATQMPCADFYDTIKEAAREAFSQMDLEEKLDSDILRERISGQ
jgi:hypothetical protein